MTEKEVQAILYKWIFDRGHILALNNTYFFGKYEADMISVTRSKHIWEYEIKISLSDFKAEARKKRKHIIYNESLKNKYHFVPSRFYYVIHGFDEPQVPKHAGLMIVKNKNIKIKKIAPLLSNRKAKERDFKKLARLLSIRYWKNFNHEKMQN